MPAKHEVRCLKCRRVLLNDVERAALRCFGCRDAPTRLGAMPTLKENDWESLIGQGMEAVKRFNGVQWILGDLAVRVLIGRQEEALIDYAGRIGIEAEVLQDYARVARAYPADMRQLGLSFSHHRQICRLDDRFKWVKAASEGKWTRQQMVDNITEADAKEYQGPETTPPSRDGDKHIQSVSDVPSQTPLNSEAPIITNHDTAPVSAAQRVEDILERVPSDMMTPVSAPAAPEPHCMTCRCFEDTGSVQSSVAEVTP